MAKVLKLLVVLAYFCVALQAITEGKGDLHSRLSSDAKVFSNGEDNQEEFLKRVKPSGKDKNMGHHPWGKGRKFPSPKGTKAKGKDKGFKSHQPEHCRPPKCCGHSGKQSKHGFVYGLNPGADEPEEGNMTQPVKGDQPKPEGGIKPGPEKGGGYKSRPEGRIKPDPDVKVGC